MVSLRLRNEIRVAHGTGGARLAIRPGSRAVKEVVEVSIIGCVALPLSSFWGFGPLIVASIAFVYFFLSALLSYIRCGIWLCESELRVGAIARVNTANLDEVAGIGVLYCAGLPAFKGKYRHIGLLMNTGQWFFATGVWGSASVIRKASEELSNMTGWPIASSADMDEARLSLLPGGA